MDKKNVLIIFGGANSEHEVSRMSVTSVLKNIDREKYNVVTVGITRAGRWLEYTGPVDAILEDTWETPAHTAPAVISPDREMRGLLRLGGKAPEVWPVDVCFGVMHGEYAEDGTIQGLFAMAGIPFVGPGVLASALCMDKEYAHLILEANGVTMARWIRLRRGEAVDTAQLAERIERELGGFPVFVKPACCGSSVGVSKVKAPDGLAAAIELALKYDKKLLIEEAITGKEVECSVLGNAQPVASDVLGEIVPEAEFYDYDAKYFDEATDLYIPARVPPEVTELVRQTALRAYTLLGCEGMARVDFFIKSDNTVVLNELNTIPGFTHISMYPKLMIASGMTYSELIDRLLELAISAR